MSNEPTTQERIAALDTAANRAFAKFDQQCERGNDAAAMKALREGRRLAAEARALEASNNAVIWREHQEFSAASTTGYTTTGLSALLTCGHFSSPVHEASSDWDFPYEEHQCPTCGAWVQYDQRVRDHLAAPR